MVDTLPKLRLPKNEISQKLQIQVDKANQLLLTIGDEAFRENYTIWNDFTEKLLLACYDGELVSLRFKQCSNIIQLQCFKQTDIIIFIEALEEQIIFLKSLIQTIDLHECAVSAETEQAQIRQVNADSKDVFIVHGRDESIKQSVARFLEKLKLNPVILHEQPNSGQNIFEKLENCAKNVGFAIVLLTPDDLGKLKGNKDNLKPRARQNVILEMGYFMALLGKGNVCALYKENSNLELPTDFDGSLYVSYDNNCGWQFKLAQEMKAAGIEVDLNNLCI